MEQMWPVAHGRHILENHKEGRPIERNCCAWTHHPPALIICFMKGPNVTCCDGRTGEEESSGGK